jgi:hypothetical protein
LVIKTLDPDRYSSYDDKMMNEVPVAGANSIEPTKEKGMLVAAGQLV